VAAEDQRKPERQPQPRNSRLSATATFNIPLFTSATHFYLFLKSSQSSKSPLPQFSTRQIRSSRLRYQSIQRSHPETRYSALTRARVSQTHTHPSTPREGELHTSPAPRATPRLRRRDDRKNSPLYRRRGPPVHPLRRDSTIKWFRVSFSFSHLLITSTSSSLLAPCPRSHSPNYLGLHSNMNMGY
jgi:hypothetical protein